MTWEEKPEDLAWFSCGAAVAWIYAAGSRAPAPMHGVANAFRRVFDLLDFPDEAPGDTTLTDRFIDEMQAQDAQ
jgi:hypothetical protein